MEGVAKKNHDVILILNLLNNEWSLTNSAHHNCSIAQIFLLFTEKQVHAEKKDQYKEGCHHNTNEVPIIISRIRQRCCYGLWLRCQQGGFDF